MEPIFSRKQPPCHDLAAVEKHDLAASNICVPSPLDEPKPKQSVNPPLPRRVVATSLLISRTRPPAAALAGLPRDGSMAIGEGFLHSAPAKGPVVGGTSSNRPIKDNRALTQIVGALPKRGMDPHRAPLPGLHVLYSRPVRDELQRRRTPP